MIPIWFIVTVLASFIWLFYESDWMRIRLPVGKATHKSVTMDDWRNVFPKPLYMPLADWIWEKPMPITPFQPSTEPVKLYRISGDSENKGISRQNPRTRIGYGNNGDILLGAGITAPLCGWEWLLKREHPPVNYEMTIMAHGCKHTILLNPDAHNGKVIQQVSQATLKPNKEERKYINKQRTAFRKRGYALKETAGSAVK